jgi:hypothetical protein
LFAAFVLFCTVVWMAVPDRLAVALEGSPSVLLDAAYSGQPLAEPQRRFRQLHSPLDGRLVHLSDAVAGVPHNCSSCRAVELDPLSGPFTLPPVPPRAPTGRGAPQAALAARGQPLTEEQRLAKEARAAAKAVGGGADLGDFPEGGDGAPDESEDDSDGARAYRAFRNKQSFHELCMVLAKQPCLDHSLDNPEVSVLTTISRRVLCFEQQHTNICGAEWSETPRTAPITLYHNSSVLKLQMRSYQCCATCPFAVLAGRNDGKFDLSPHSFGFAPATAVLPTMAFSYHTCVLFMNQSKSADVAAHGATTRHSKGCAFHASFQALLPTWGARRIRNGRPRSSSSQPPLSMDGAFTAALLLYHLTRACGSILRQGDPQCLSQLLANLSAEDPINDCPACAMCSKSLDPGIPAHSPDGQGTDRTLHAVIADGNVSIGLHGRNKAPAASGYDHDGQIRHFASMASDEVQRFFNAHKLPAQFQILLHAAADESAGCGMDARCARYVPAGL